MMKINYSKKAIEAFKSISHKFKKIKPKISNTILYACHKDNMLIATWWVGEGGKNWGDALNPVIINKISGKKIINYEYIYSFKETPVYSVIGSILGRYNSSNLIVWGSGFISTSSIIKKKVTVCAVRGPLTREKLLKQGIDCPEIYGDPALLYPLFYNPKKTNKYKLGIIPHFVDQKNSGISKLEVYKNIIIIDILSDTNSVVDQICSCEMIASSSLHGIIAADAYRIPSIWIELSNKIQGDRFKFYDYFSSVGRELEEPLFISEKSTPEEIYKSFREYTITIDLLKLLNACPFIDEEKKHLLEVRLNNLHSEG
ncbi:polysaccharide pyruvyl transferase family protein [Methanolobus halotolerans]|uniref:Polysaccharide pyruvyl transferase family protein n=1 Tax=Methanolobus halotolerans TaxID=2052935 RepID=A0A4E0Q9I2_9EURY|nr:polysaccharide pyruvyl transferase family protein [Methanolobus halotolerans]TGC11570.1 polysaccharide pyruvyl transferase family protein [Methanolobus halotolerans]